MGDSKTAAELAGKLNGVAKSVPKATRNGIQQASLKGKLTIYSIATQRRVPPGSRIAGGKWDVRYDIKGTDHPVSLLRIRGPFHLVENATRPHDEPRTGPRRRKRKKAMAFNGVVRGRVHHPGTHGKHIFRDAKRKIIKDTPPIIAKSIVVSMTQELNG